VALAAREVVRDPQGQAFLVQAIPQGGLKTVTPTSGPVTWLSGLPGEMGLLGLLNNKIVHRGRWTVLVRPLAGSRPSAPVWSEEAKKHASRERAGRGGDAEDAQRDAGVRRR
jgi:hypothetical protein